MFMMDVVTVKSKMVLLVKFGYAFVFYINFEGIIMNYLWWGIMSQSAWRSCLCIWRSGMCIWRSSMCQLSIEHQGVGPLIIYYYAFVYQSLCCCMQCQPKSCSRSYMHFCVPWILDDFSNDPCTGTTNDFDCCWHWLSICVGKCSIARPWFSQGLVGSKTLPLHL